MLPTTNKFLLARTPVRFPISLSLLSDIDNGHTTAHPPRVNRGTTLHPDTARSTGNGHRLMSTTLRNRNRIRQHRTDSQPQSSAYQLPPPIIQLLGLSQTDKSKFVAGNRLPDDLVLSWG